MSKLFQQMSLFFFFYSLHVYSQADPPYLVILENFIEFYFPGFNADVKERQRGWERGRDSGERKEGERENENESLFLFSKKSWD